MNALALAWEQHRAGRNLRTSLMGNPTLEDYARSMTGSVLQERSGWEWPLHVNARAVLECVLVAMVAMQLVSGRDAKRFLRARRK